MKTVTVFRKFKKDGDIIALFPQEINYPDGACESYQHIGQHSAADYGHCLTITVPAKPEEYAPLKRDLERIGYDLKIVRRNQWKR